VTDVSKSVKLAGRLPGSEEMNGLLPVIPDILANPTKNRLAVIWFSAPNKITDNPTTGERVPTLTIHRLEPLGDVDEASQALRELVMQKIDDRLGNAALPFDEVDPNPVEVLDEDGGDES
jgi:hypothetical protein